MKPLSLTLFNRLCVFNSLCLQLLGGIIRDADRIPTTISRFETGRYHKCQCHIVAYQDPQGFLYPLDLFILFHPRALAESWGGGCKLYYWMLQLLQDYLDLELRTTVWSSFCALKKSLCGTPVSGPQVIKLPQKLYLEMLSLGCPSLWMNHYNWIMNLLQLHQLSPTVVWQYLFHNAADRKIHSPVCSTMGSFWMNEKLLNEWELPKVWGII